MSGRDSNYEAYVIDAVDQNPEDGNGDNLTNRTNNAAGDIDPDWQPSMP